MCCASDSINGNCVIPFPDLVSFGLEFLLWYQSKVLPINAVACNILTSQDGWTLCWCLIAGLVALDREETSLLLEQVPPHRRISSSILNCYDVPRSPIYCSVTCLRQTSGESLLQIQLIAALTAFVSSLGYQSPLSYHMLIPILQSSKNVDSPNALNLLEDSVLVVGTLSTHHQKYVLVDTQAWGNKRKITAFIGGLDLCDGRYYTPEHRLFKDLDTVFEIDYHNPTFQAQRDPDNHGMICTVRSMVQLPMMSSKILSNAGKRQQNGMTDLEKYLIGKMMP